jgi:excisionase family DNA binding protein
MGSEVVQINKSNGSSQLQKRLFSIKEAAVILGRSPWVIHNMVRTGKIAYIQDGKRIFLDINDINAWIEKSKRIDNYE